MRSSAIVVACLVVALATTASTAADLRMAIAGPAGTAAAQALDKIGEQIATKTDKRIVIRHYLGGETADIVRMMGLGQIDGAELSMPGLTMIDPGITVFALPRLFADAGEASYVADKMWPTFQTRFEAKGYTLLTRSGGTFSAFRSKTPTTSLADLKARKIWLDGNDQVIRVFYKRLGLNTVPLGTPEVANALVMGRVDTVAGTAADVVNRQWGQSLVNLIDTPLVWQISAVVVTKRVFDSIAAADRTTVTGVYKAAATALSRAAASDEDTARQTLSRRGLRIAAAPAALVADLDSAAGQARGDLVPKTIPQDLVTEAMKYRDEYRAKAKR